MSKLLIINLYLNNIGIQNYFSKEHTETMTWLFAAAKTIFLQNWHIDAYSARQNMNDL